MKQLYLCIHVKLWECKHKNKFITKHYIKKVEECAWEERWTGRTTAGVMNILEPIWWKDPEFCSLPSSFHHLGHDTGKIWQLCWLHLQIKKYEMTIMFEDRNKIQNKPEDLAQSYKVNINQHKYDILYLDLNICICLSHLCEN